MIEVDRRNDADRWPGNDIRCVEASAHADFEDNGIGGCA